MRPTKCFELLLYLWNVRRADTNVCVWEGGGCWGVRSRMENIENQVAKDTVADIIHSNENIH